MTISANTVWEVRTTGNDTQCGGGFDATIASAGTDYSQQNSAQATGTVTSSTTTVTATAGIFTAAMVGNIITNGTMYKQITAYTSATVVTVDSAPAWTSATVYVGGALASPGKVAGLLVPGNWVYQKSGTYTLSTSSSNVAGGIVILTASPPSDAQPLRWIGYQATRGDNGTKPVIQVPASGVVSVDVFAITGGYNFQIENMQVDGGTATGITGFNCTNSNGRSALIRCKASNCAFYGFNGAGASTYLILCESVTCNNRGFSLAGCLAINCISHGGGAYGFVNSFGSFIGCIAYSNGGPGFSATDSIMIANCISYANTSDGFNFAQRNCMLLNCLAVNNGGYGFNAANSSTPGSHLFNCAAYSNTSGAKHAGLTTTESFLSLTINPFNNAAGGDFSLNNLAGGGALCRAGGLLGSFPGLSSTTGYQDIGAVQHRDPLKIRGRLGDGR